MFPPTNLDPADVQQLDASRNDAFFGKLDDFTAAGYVKGACGDRMEFYLVIENGVIREVRYHTDGCESTRAAGVATARRAKGRKVMDALCISPGEIIKAGEISERDGYHCAILAVSTLYQALADYLLNFQ